MIADQLKEFVKVNYSDKKEVVNFRSIIKTLNEGKFVNKEILLNDLIAFISFNDNFINTISQGLILAEANYQAYKFLVEQYEKQAPPMHELISFAEEIEDALTQQENEKGKGVPKYSKKCLEALKNTHVKYEKEIQEIIKIDQ